MKNMIKEVLEQLSHKERHVSDLADFLKNKCENTPNYTLLMGAGCSVTSGISTGADLVKRWKNDIYEKEKKEGETEDTFWSNQFRWYDPSNEYSSLFQKKYDLPRQRRIFVENEVAGKNPAIGYAYLIKLIENNYFNAVFTTNFDDLLNEAFYRFSSTRPIVCAHDSSISSITVTSRRPKIIKLHGDYLFDDIKSTLRETESLNDNMKAKFIEFAKDHGLIVVGYAGNDRSIMDILTMLLQKDEYFKYGIYWCIREGDNTISDELRQLLWKDRVYFVKISGFDELMAELNLHLNDGKLPIEDELLSSKKQRRMIADLTDEKYFSPTTSQNEIIKKDIKRLSKNLKKNIINDFLDIMDEKNRNVITNAEAKRRTNLKVLTEDERRIIDDIQELMADNNTDEALFLLNKHLSENESRSQFVSYLYDLQIRLYKNMPEKEKELQEAIDKYIELRPNEVDSYLRAFFFIKDFEKRIEYINRAINLYPQYIDLYNNKASSLINECFKTCDNSKREDYLSDIKESIETSLGIDSTPYNNAWLLKCEFIRKNESDIEKAKQQIKSVIDSFSHIKTKYLSKAYYDYYELLGIDADECENKLKDIYSYSLGTDDLSFIESSVINLLKFYMTTGKEDRFNEFVKSYERDFIPSEDFEYNKAVAYTSHFAKFEIAEDIIYNGMNDGRYSSRWKSLAFDYLCETKQKDRAKRLLDKYFKNDINKLIDYYSMCNDEKLIEILENYWNTNPHTLSHVSQYACICMYHNQYQKAYNICKKYYDDPKNFDGTLYINYFLSDMKYNAKKRVSDRIESKIINKKNQFSEIVLAAAYALKGDENQMYTHLKSAIKKDFLLKFKILEWPVFKEFANDKRFKDLADTSELMNFEKKIDFS